MEIRVLQYFLAVAREQNISNAAKSLHLTQPTLSRQLKDLEDSLGKQLFIRGSKKITLTEEGILLRKRAEQILELVERTEAEITNTDEAISGDVYIGAGETDIMCLIAKTAKKLQEQYPNIHYHIYSGDSLDILDRLNKGIIDFGMVFGKPDASKYEMIAIKQKDIWGVLMRRDSMLAQKESITADNLKNMPLIMSRQQSDGSPLQRWFGCSFSALNIVSSYNLIYNGSVMVKEGLGYAIALDKLINVSGDSNLCFKPLFPLLTAELYFIFPKYQVRTRAADAFLTMFINNNLP